MINPFSLEGKTILVTGASSGIGRSISIECAKMGGDVIITGRNKERLEETIKIIGKGRLFIADLANDLEIESIVKDLPELDGVVHCAGISKIKMVRQLNRRSLHEIMDANVFGPLSLNSALLKNKRMKKGASIVIVSSISGWCVSNVGEGGYGASKAALAGYAKSAAIELAHQDIRVNCIHPGVVETPLLEVSNSLFSKEQLEQLKSNYPLKRFGNPEDIAHAVVYFLSDASSWVTGANFVIDGGYTLR